MMPTLPTIDAECVKSCTNSIDSDADSIDSDTDSIVSDAFPIDSIQTLSRSILKAALLNSDTDLLFQCSDLFQCRDCDVMYSDVALTDSDAMTIISISMQIRLIMMPMFLMLI